MSLQYWLPLISNTENQGLTGVAVNAYNATTFSDSLFKTGLKFNGSSTYLQGTVYTTANMTYMMWLYFDSATGCHVIDCRDANGAGYQPMYINPSTGVQVGGTTSTFPYIPYVFTANIWYHIAVTYSPTKCQLFINGSLVGENTGAKGTNINANQPFYIGSRYTQANWFNGRMNDLRIYDHTCSAKEIAEIAKGLYIHYKLTDNTTITDCSGFKNHGQKIGILSLNNSSPRYDKSVTSSAGAANYIASLESLSPNCKTVSFWVNMNFNSNQTIFADKSNYWALFYYQSRDRFLVGTGAGNENHYTFPRTAMIEGWNHIAIVREGTYTKHLFINGEEIDPDTSYSDYYTQNAGLLNIFRRNYNDAPAATNMSLSDFRIYLTALSAKSIKELYNESVAIDKNNNIHSREFVESTTGISIKETGQLISNSFQEDATNTFFKKTGTVKCKELYEY